MQNFNLNNRRAIFLTFYFAFLFFSFFSLYSQKNTKLTILGSAGGIGHSISGSVQYQVGEPLVSSSKNGNEWLFNGFVQPSMGFVSMKGIISSIELQIFPNPFTDIITVKCKDCENLIFQLVDISGKFFNEEIVNNNFNDSYQINTSLLNSGIYLFIVKNQRNETVLIHRLIKIEN